MVKYKLNLIDAIQKEEIEHKPALKKSSFLKLFFKKFLKILIILFIVGILIFSRGLITEESLIKEIPKASFWTGVARSLIFHERLMSGELSDRINLLILGVGGTEHDGADLSDTIILASFKPSTQEIALISFPRDLWVPIPNYGWNKINHANAYGKKTNNGAEIASQVVSEITNLSIHYFVRIDFAGYQEIIDTLGGIEVEVERSFVDPQYPGPNYTFRTISFKKGQQLMSGDRALEYVRSRHGTNNEGSDFARAQRQQKIIFAIKEKLEEIKIFENPQKSWILFNLIKKYFETNLSLEELISFSQKLKGLSSVNIINQTFDLSENSTIYSDMYNGTYILRTKTGDFREISSIAKNIFEKEKAIAAKQTKKKQILLFLTEHILKGWQEQNLNYLFLNLISLKLAMPRKKIIKKMLFMI